MKRNFFVFSCVAIAIAWSGGAYYFCSKKIVSNHLLLENVEALTGGDTGSVSSSHSCNKQIYFLDDNSGKNFSARYCGDCKEHIVTRVWGEDNCHY